MPKNASAGIALLAFLIIASPAAATAPDQSPDVPAAAPADSPELGPVYRGPSQLSTTLEIPRHFQLLLHHDLAHNDPKAYVVLLDDHYFPNPLPAVGDILVIDDTHTVKVTTRTFSDYDYAGINCRFCDLKIYTDPVAPAKKSAVKRHELRIRPRQHLRADARRAA
jgi:hypothetical protein